MSEAGFSARDAIDVHGLNHTGDLSWEASGDVTYPLALPPTSAVDLDLEVDRVRWGEYRQDTGGLLIDVTCPRDGLEIAVSGELDLPGLGLALSVNGNLLAPRYDGDEQDLQDLSWSLQAPLSASDGAAFLPALDAFAEAEGFDYDDVDLSLVLVVSATTESAGLGVTWFEGDTVADRGLPFGAVLSLDR